MTSIEQLVEEFGTPLYVYETMEVGERLAQLRQALPPSRLLYSLKANPLPGLIRTLAEHGCGAEVSSHGELRDALAAGFRPQDLVLTGPGKTDAELDEAFEAGVRDLSCESWVDLERVAVRARRAGCRPRVLLRMATSHTHGAGLSMTGADRQFGLATAELAPGRAEALAADVELVGIHVYSGTQIPDVDELLAAFRRAFDVAAASAEALAIELRTVAGGGGFPWPFGQPGTGPALDGLREPLAAAARARVGDAELWFEAGRFLTASSGTLVTRVLDVKRREGQRQAVIVDGGVNVLGGMSGLRRLLPNQLAPRRAGAVDAAGGEPGDVYGPLCTPLDMLARGAEVGAVAPDDLLTIPNVGAYGLTASLVAFLGRVAPTEVLLADGAVHSASRMTLERVDRPRRALA
jgi:diaminopimelate decarboxylase